MDSRKHIRKSLLSTFRVSGLLAVSALALMLIAPAWAQERDYTTIPTPEGTRSATAWGINARGDIVGTFVDKSSAQHGFLLRNGHFTVIDFPGAKVTIARGIGPNGTIVGSYQLPGDPALASRGFLRDKHGHFYNVKFPGSIWEIAQRILPDGTIVGCRHDNDTIGSMRGMMIGRHGPSEIDAFASMQNGATPDLRLRVGLWLNMMDNQTQGYMIRDGTFTSFMYPGSDATAAWDVSPDGAIVGVYNVGTTQRGFIRTESPEDNNNHGDGEDPNEITYTTIDYPGSTATRAFGINARGDIVGNYVLDRVTYAFLAPRVED